MPTVRTVVKENQEARAFYFTCANDFVHHLRQIISPLGLQHSCNEGIPLR